MAKELTKTELLELINKRDAELSEIQQELDELLHYSYVQEDRKRLEGKVEVYERLMSLVEKYLDGIREGRGEE